MFDQNGEDTGLELASFESNDYEEPDLAYKMDKLLDPDLGESIFNQGMVTVDQVEGVMMNEQGLCRVEGTDYLQIEESFGESSIAPALQVAGLGGTYTDIEKNFGESSIAHAKQVAGLGGILVAKELEDISQISVATALQGTEMQMAIEECDDDASVSRRTNNDDMILERGSILDFLSGNRVVQGDVDLKVTMHF